MRIKTYLLAVLVLFICMDSYSQIRWKNQTGNQAVAQFGGEVQTYITESDLSGTTFPYRQIFTREGDSWEAVEWRVATDNTAAAVNRVVNFVTATQVLKLPSDTKYLSLNIRSGTSTITAATTPQMSGVIHMCSFSVGLFPTLQEALAISDANVSLPAKRSTGSILATGAIPTTYDHIKWASASATTTTAKGYITFASTVSMDNVYKDIDAYGNYILPTYGMDHLVIQSRLTLPHTGQGGVLDVHAANQKNAMPTAAITISVQFKQDK